MAGGTLVTGFLGFDRFPTNPAAELARNCGRPFELIDVSYAAVDGFVATLAARDFDALVMLGVDGRIVRPQLECIARNQTRAEPDVHGVVHETGRIDDASPDQVRATLWDECDSPPDSLCARSHHAGGYLCNYLFFRAVRACEHAASKRLGFVHVPPVEYMPIERQQAALKQLLAWIDRSRIVSGASRAGHAASSSAHPRSGTKTDRSVPG